MRLRPVRRWFHDLYNREIEAYAGQQAAAQVRA
jgi:hypothetical protein